MNNTLVEVKKDIQLIINEIVANNLFNASEKLIVVSNKLDDLLDTTNDEETLVEISKCQLLLNHLQIKMSKKE